VSLPPAPVCRTCGTPAEPRQEYCLECGNRLVPPRRAPAVAAWIVPSLVTLVVATGGAAASIAATNGRASRGSHALVALSPLQPAPPPPPSTPKPAGQGKLGQRLIAWPATNGYTIVLASLPLSGGARAARSKALAAVKAGLPKVGVLVSSSYPSLQPGYYVVFSGVFPSLEEAQSALQAAKSSFPSAYARPIVR
jgi:SPOR domain